MKPDHDKLIRAERDIKWMQKNLVLQAKEYERRLNALNHAYEQAQQTARTYVTQDKYEDYVRTEREARDKALDRVDESFASFRERYESRHAQISDALKKQEGSVEASAAATAAFTRRVTLAIGLAGMLISLIVLFANRTI